MLENNDIRPLIPRVYTSNFHDSIEEIVQRNIWLIISHLFPRVILTHRTALEYKISPNSCVYMTAKSRRVYRWPGVELRIASGEVALENDGYYIHDLRVSSFERACLENLSVSRVVGGEKRTVDQAYIEERLVEILNTKGEEKLNEIRDKAKVIAKQLNLEKAYAILHLIIGSILTTRPSSVLKSSVANSHAIGEPYDAKRLELFSILIAELKQQVFPSRPQKTDINVAFSNFSFFESYFSNFIEGTTFYVDEAKDIIFEGKDLPLRIEDSHDVRGTFSIVSNRKEMSRIPRSGDQFLKLLKERHAIILGGRKDKNPGVFKKLQNRAGNTYFVEPKFVEGTLKQGYELMKALVDPIARAIYMMFLVSEVHPFDDGNGRIARVMMNAELVHTETSKIIIPTIFRDDYMLALRKLTRQVDPSVYIKAMNRVSAFSHWLEPLGWKEIHLQFESSNAYKEPDEVGQVLMFNEN